MNRLHTPASLALAFLLAGCGSQADAPMTIMEGVVEAGVSWDQSHLAYFTEPSLLTNGVFTGALQVVPLMPLPTGPAVPLGDSAFDVSFARSTDTLYFHTGPAKDVTTGSFAGNLWIWTANLAAPVALSTGYVPRGSTTPDNAVHLFVDDGAAAAPDENAPGQVKLVRAGDCAGASCVVTTLASDVVVAATRVSLDGRYVAYDTLTSVGGVQTYDIFLVTVADGTVTHVASTTIPAQVVGEYHLAAFAPDGSLLATLTTVSGSALQLQVISTATGKPVPWASPPAGTLCTNVLFSDSGTLLVGVEDGSGGSTYHRTTATEDASLVSASQIFVNHEPSGAERYLFFSTTSAADLANGARYDLQLLDLSAKGAPVPLAVSTRTSPLVSDDLSSVWFLESYDPSTGKGTLVEAALPGGQLSTVASPVGSWTANFGGGTNHLFYSGTGDLVSTVPNVVGEPLEVFRQGMVQEVEPDALRWDTAPGPTLYVTADNPLRIYRMPLP